MNTRLNVGVGLWSVSERLPKLHVGDLSGVESYVLLIFALGERFPVSPVRIATCGSSRSPQN